MLKYLPIIAVLLGLLVISMPIANAAASKVPGTTCKLGLRIGLLIVLASGLLLAAMYWGNTAPSGGLPGIGGGVKGACTTKCVDTCMDAGGALQDCMNSCGM